MDIPLEMELDFFQSDAWYYSATLDPLFNETYKMPLPEKRKYKKVVPYRGYSIATYLQDSPIYHVGNIPVYCVYFALDEMGDSLTPVDTCFWSPFLAIAMVDAYAQLTDGDKAEWWKQQGMWKLIHANYRLQRMLPPVVDILRTVAAECADSDVSVMFDDAQEFADHITKILKPALDGIDSTGIIPGAMELK